MVTLDGPMAAILPSRRSCSSAPTLSAGAPPVHVVELVQIDLADPERAQADLAVLAQSVRPAVDREGAAVAPVSPS